jgi:hypothetical protein
MFKILPVVLLAAGTFFVLRLISYTTRIYLEAVNPTLEGAINYALQVTLEKHFVKPAGHRSVEKFRSFQDKLVCLLEAGNNVQNLHSELLNSCPPITDHCTLLLHCITLGII